MAEKRGQVNVITSEDPPEYVIKGAAQLPVTNATTDDERNEKFRQAISASLRSDPDLVMIGEIRDKASAALAFAAAMTGHQVWPRCMRTTLCRSSTVFVTSGSKNTS